MGQPFFLETLLDQANKLNQVHILRKDQFLPEADPGNFCARSRDFQDL